MPALHDIATFASANWGNIASVIGLLISGVNYVAIRSTKDEVKRVRGRLRRRDAIVECVDVLAVLNYLRRHAIFSSDYADMQHSLTAVTQKYAKILSARDSFAENEIAFLEASSEKIREMAQHVTRVRLKKAKSLRCEWLDMELALQAEKVNVIMTQMMEAEV